MQLIATEKTVAENKHYRETVLADTRKAAEKQQQEYGLMARRRRLTAVSFDLPPVNKDERHQNLLQQILKYESIFDSLKLATHSHDKHVSPRCSSQQTKSCQQNRIQRMQQSKHVENNILDFEETPEKH